MSAVNHQCGAVWFQKLTSCGVVLPVKNSLKVQTTSGDVQNLYIQIQKLNASPDSHYIKQRFKLKMHWELNPEHRG